MTKRLKLMLVILCMLCTSSMYAEKHGGTCGKSANWLLDTETGILSITGSGKLNMYDFHCSRRIAEDGRMTDLHIETSAPWFEYKDYIRKLEISDGITNIHHATFAGLENLAEINIPDGITVIDNEAFLGTAWWREQPDGLLYINNWLLGYKGSQPKGKLSIKKSIKGIAIEAFDGCKELTSVEFPKRLTTICRYAFRDCEGLVSINIPKRLTNIESMAFYRCSGLQTIVVDKKNTVYDSREDCNALIETATNTLIVGSNNTVIPSSIVKIENSAFSGYTDLDNIVIPESVTNIESYAFKDCSGLKELYIPKNVTSISMSAFEGCSGLQNIIVEDGNPYYDSRNGCKAIIVTETNNLIQGCNNTIIPDGIQRISDSAFKGCLGLTNVNIPASVTNIGKQVFEGSGWYNAQPNGLLYLDNWLLGYKGNNSNNKTGEKAKLVEETLPCDVVIKDGTVGIAQGAFIFNSTLTSVTIPGSVRTFGVAFCGCHSLKKVVICDGVTSIDELAFAGCTELESVTIPNSVTKIDNFAFNQCFALKQIILPANIKKIGGSVFDSCSALTSITSKIPAKNLFAAHNLFDEVDNKKCTLHVPRGAKEAYSQTDGWNKIKNIVEEPIE